MFNDLSKYGFLNAKIRAKIGNVISDNTFEDLKNNKNYKELINFLIGKRYLSQDSDYTEVEKAEFQLFAYLVSEYRTIYISTNDKNLKKVMFKLMERLEIENFKNLFRIWVKKGDSKSLENSVYKNGICYNLDFDKMLDSEDADIFIENLKETPYYDYIKDDIEEFRSSKSLFKIEISLDRNYYRDLFNSLNLLTKQDREIVKKFIGFEIDVENLLILLRNKNYYKLKSEDALKNIIGEGWNLSYKFLSNFYSGEGLNVDFFKIFSSAPRYITEEITKKLNQELHLKNKMMLIEDMLQQVILTESKNRLSGFPFTIGIVIVFLLLKRMEVNRIQSLLNLKYYEII